jgi:hypothetical protein
MASSLFLAHISPPFEVSYYYYYYYYYYFNNSNQRFKLLLTNPLSSSPVLLLHFLREDWHSHHSVPQREEEAPSKQANNHQTKPIVGRSAPRCRHYGPLIHQH